MPGEGSKNTIRSKRFVTESAVDFYTVTFLTPPQTLVSRIYYRVVRSFPAFHYDVTKMCLGSRIEHQEKSMWTAIIFVVRDSFYLWSEHLMTYRRVIIGTFVVVGNISQQMKEKTNKQTNKNKNKQQQQQKCIREIMSKTKKIHTVPF